MIAFRARFVGGRPSVFCSPEAPGIGEVLPRTTPAVDDLTGFGREAAGVCEDEGGFGSDIVRGKVEERWEGRPDRNVLCNINKQSRIRHGVLSQSLPPEASWTYIAHPLPSGDKW